MISFKHTLVISSLLILGLAGGCATSKSAQSKKSPPSPPKKEAKKGSMKPYDKVITKEATTDKGLFDVHKVDDKYYYEIPDSLLSRVMLLESRIAKTENGIGYGGEELNTQVIRWQRMNDNILLRHVSYENVANDTLPIYQAVKNSNFEPIIQTFPIKAISKDSSSVVIDVTDLFTKDVPSIGLQNRRRTQYKVRRLDGDRTFIIHIHSYPQNIEARNLLTYIAGSPPSESSTGTISIETNHSMVLLPKDPMRARSYDPRVGFFSVSQTDYGTNYNEAKQVQYVTRWKLVPKDKEAYMRGELVEPVHPLVYYIDPATPKKWRPYLIQGIKDWQKAFEQAGFKNAITAKVAPTKEEDPDFSLEDSRYSVLRYFASDIENAYGPNVHDPRSGQIMETHIGWYHNVMKLVRDWYFVQTAAANPEARHVQFADSTMGELIRFVSSHEVGHTLGLAHNFGSSYAYPVDSLRSPTFTSTHGTAPSIMDYARFNYVAQPGDGVKDFHPAIGEYDKWAIKWGYTWFPDNMSKKQIEDKLDSWVVDRADDPRFFYGKQTGSQIDPRSQNEDLSNDAMKASSYGIANLKRIMNHLIEWTNRKNANYDDLDELYNQIIAQWSRYMGHVARNIGGVYENNKTYNQAGPVYSPVPEKKQQRAMDFLNEQAFATPSWMLNKDILDRINQSTVVDNIRGAQERVLNQVLDPQRIARLIEFQARDNDKNTYDAFTMLDELRHGVWSELDHNTAISVYRRNLQRAYLERMEYLMTHELPTIPARYRQFIGFTQVDVSQSDIRPMVRNQLEILLASVKKSESKVSDRATRIHLKDVQHRIEDILNPDHSNSNS